MRRLVALAAVVVAVIFGAGAGASAGSTGSFTGSFFGGGSSSSGGSFSVGPSGVAAGPIVIVPVKFSGALIVTFRGNRAAGCESRGLCRYTGTVLWQPPRSGELVIASYRVRRHTQYFVGFTPGSYSGQNGVAQAHVVSGSTSCTDSSPSEATVQTQTRGGSVTITLKHADPSLTLTRCAGPISEDYAGALSSRSMDVKKLMRGRTTINLASVGLFSANGFVGALKSSVVVRLGRPKVIKPARPAPSRGRTIRRRTVDVAYRVRVVGDVIERFHGATQVCDVVGSCRLAGSVDLHVNERGGRGDLFAQTSVRRPYRDVLTALGLGRGGNPKGISALGIIELRSPGTAHGGLGICRDTTRTDPGTLFLNVAHAALRAHYYDLGSGFRNRCPGPLAKGFSVALGGPAVAALGPRTTTFTLDRGAPIRSEGYAGEVVAHLRVTMTRIKITAKVVTYRLG